jgi:hypothetical protein
MRPDSSGYKVFESRLLTIQAAFTIQQLYPPDVNSSSRQVRPTLSGKPNRNTVFSGYEYLPARLFKAIIRSSY